MASVDTRKKAPYWRISETIPSLLCAHGWVVGKVHVSKTQGLVKTDRWSISNAEDPLPATAAVLAPPNVIRTAKTAKLPSLLQTELYSPSLRRIVQIIKIEAQRRRIALY